MNPYLYSQSPSNGTTQSTEETPDISQLWIAGNGPGAFQYNSDGEWRWADKVEDNGPQRGYSVYYLGEFLGIGSLIVYDEIDNEQDVLSGGEIPPGWVTNFPDGFVVPPAKCVDRYKIIKAAYRQSLTSPPPPPPPPGPYSSTGESVYKLASKRPATRYRLRTTNKEIGSDPFAVGYNGEDYRYPTVLSSKPMGEGNSSAMSDTSNVTLGRSSGGGCA